MPHESSPSTSQTIAVTGSTGFVGCHVVRELLARGFGVRALARDKHKAAKVLPVDDKLVVIEGDIFSGDARRTLFEGASGCVHLVGIRRESRAKGITFQRMHVEVTQRVIESAVHAGARRFVHMSGLGTRSEARSTYHKTNHEAEILIRNAPLDWTILRPSVIHGVQSEFVRMTHEFVMGRTQPGFFLPYFETSSKTLDMLRPGEQAAAGQLQPVSVEDVAWSVAQCLATDTTIGEIYPLGGPVAYTWPELWETIRDATPDARHTSKPWGIPTGVGIGLAKLAAGIGVSDLLPFCESDVIMSTEDNTCSNAKASEHFGFSPSPFEPAFREYAQHLH